jgi:hypothetical protein
MKQPAMRFNQNKLRFDLLPEFAMTKLAEVMQVGALKYAERNWEKGLPWMSCYASLRRHQSAWLRGEDLDPEDGLPHIAKVATNAIFLLEYFKTQPEWDDRPQGEFEKKRISLDVDGVLSDFLGTITSNGVAGFHCRTDWNFTWDKIDWKGLTDEFWLSMPPLVGPDLPFEVSAYISNRPCAEEVTETWLKKHGFPAAPVIHTANKAQAVAELEIDWHVDDSPKVYRELINSGLCCFLMDRPYNQNVNARFRRIKSLEELRERYG